MRPNGTPLTLAAYAAESLTHRQFREFGLELLDRVYLPPSMAGLCDTPPLETRTFVEDDNRGAILPEPIATLDGLPFFLSVKGVGSTVDPYSHRALDASCAGELTDDEDLRARLARPAPGAEPRLITGELWLRGSPYGGQGLEHATTALQVSEMADLTSIHGFRIAPVVKVCFVPTEIAERVRRLYWYRRYPGRIVQELRLVPSNVRVFFHARSTLGTSVRHVFDLFGVDRPATAVRFEVNLVRSAVAMLTLYARTLRALAPGDRYGGLDLHDVWLDKDAVVAPDGTAYFVDLEGIEEVPADAASVRERMEDQIYRSLYEFVFAYEQVEQERVRRFGEPADRRSHFERILGEALRDDPFARLRAVPGGVELEVRNLAREERFNFGFRILDH